jgi:hypothetical protein
VFWRRPRVVVSSCEEDRVGRRGVVAAINRIRGMVGIKTDDSGFTIIELLSDWDLEVGDVVTWRNGYGLGSEIYENETRGTHCEVYVQNHDVSQAALGVQLRL